MNLPTVSVCVIVYNHEKFIAQTLESILSQKTEFSFEIRISNDCSSDNSDRIISEFKSKYPQKIHYYNQSENLGMSANFAFTLSECKGTYIAICEGDDYWTDVHKLQTQVDYLESSTGAVGCFHNSICVDENSSLLTETYFKNSNKRVFTQKDCLITLQSSYSTASLVFLNAALTKELDVFKEYLSDFILDILITEYGTLHYIDKNMSAYRIHSGGVWQGNSELKNKKAELTRYLFLFHIPKLRKRYKTHLYQHILKLYHQIIEKEKETSLQEMYKKNQIEFLDFSLPETYRYFYQRFLLSMHYRLKAFKNK